MDGLAPFLAFGAIAAIIFPIVLFVILVMIWKELRRISDIVSGDADYYYDEEEDYDEEFEEEEFEEDVVEAPAPKSKGKSKSKSAQADPEEEFAPGEHMEDGVVDLERE